MDPVLNVHTVEPADGSDVGGSALVKGNVSVTGGGGSLDFEGALASVDDGDPVECTITGQDSWQGEVSGSVPGPHHPTTYLRELLEFDAKERSRRST